MVQDFGVQTLRYNNNNNNNTPNNTDSAVLQAARCLEAEVQKETRKMDSIAEKKIYGREKDAWKIAT